MRRTLREKRRRRVRQSCAHFQYHQPSDSDDAEEAPGEDIQVTAVRHMKLSERPQAIRAHADQAEDRSKRRKSEPSRCVHEAKQVLLNPRSGEAPPPTTSSTDSDPVLPLCSLPRIPDVVTDSCNRDEYETKECENVSAPIRPESRTKEIENTNSAPSLTK